jgi:hypothetical protein
MHLRRIAISMRSAIAALALLFVVSSQACTSAPEHTGVVQSAVTFASTWVSLGPDLISDGQTFPSGFPHDVTGRLSVVTANPLNPFGDIWVGGGSGGLWHATPSNLPFNPLNQVGLLLDWTPMLDSLSPLSIGAIKLTGCNATRCNNVWVGTGENSIRRDTYYGNGVAVGRWNGSAYVFTTGLGASTFTNGSITGLVVDPMSTFPNETVYVALSSGEVAGAADGTIRTTPSGTYGIYKSTNSGTSWSLILSVSGVKPTDLEMDPNNAQILYAGLQSAGFRKSINGGSTWTTINTNLDASLLTGGGTPADWAELAIAPSQTSTLYAALAQCPHPATTAAVGWCKPAIYVSTTSGSSWTLQSAFDGAPGAGTFGDPLSTYSMFMHKLAVHPTTPTTVYFTGTMLSHSTDSGSSGSWSTSDGLHPDHHDVFLFMNNGSLVAYDASDAGFLVGDGVSNWDRGASQFGLQITQLQSLATFPSSPVNLISGTQDNGTNTFHGTVLWKHRDGGDAASTFMDVDDPTTAYDVYDRFMDSPRRCKGNFACGTSWPSITTNLGVGDDVAYYPPMLQGGILPVQPNNTTNHCLLLASYRLYSSCNQGDMWFPIGSLTPTDHTSSFSDINSKNVITAIGQAPTNASHAYVGYYNGEIWASTNMNGSGNGTWSKKKAGLTGAAYPVSSIAVDPTDETAVWAGFTGVASGSFVNLWRSTNSGQKWTDWSAGIAQKHVNSVAVLKDGTNTYVLAGTDDGVYVRGPSDSQMNLLASGLPKVPVYGLFVDNTNGKLYAATHGRGVWVLDFNQTPMIFPDPYYCPDCNPFGPDPVSGPGVLTLYGLLLPANQSSCTVTLFQGATQCATGSTDADGATIHTDAGGRLVADKAGAYTNKPLVWGCLGAKCVGDTGLSACMSAAVTQARVTCGTMTKTVPISTPSGASNPPSAFFSIQPDTNVAHPTYTLTLNARLRPSSGALQTLCSVSQSFSPGTSADTILTAFHDAIATNPTCIGAGVTANVTTSGGGGEGEDTPRSALNLRSSTQIGRQLFPEIQGNTYGLLQVDGFGLAASVQLEAPMLTIAVPAGAGAAGGSLTIAEVTSMGRCTYSVPTTAGDSASVIATNIATMFNSSSNDNPCRDLQKARDVFIANSSGTLARTVFAAGDELSIQSSDPNVTATVGPSGW